jgi:hypothetical protein
MQKNIDNDVIMIQIPVKIEIGLIEVNEIDDSVNKV